MVTLTEIFKDIVWDNLVTVALNAFFAAVPFFGLPVIRNITTYIVTTFADIFYKGVAEHVDLSLVVIRKESTRKKFNTVALELKLVALKQGADTDAYRKARDAHKKAFSEHVQFGTARAA